MFGIPYKIFPIIPETTLQQEQKELDLLKSYNIDTVVMARYMQVLSDDFLQAYPNNIINIHHSFLPAFSGGKPYHQANERGVKLIGATAHYATLDLDDGPIITQDVIHVSHRDDVQNFIRKGKILERNVLAQALQAHLDDRIIVYNNKCVVFGD
jgi:formyltetrahydrofolate deformylase